MNGRPCIPHRSWLRPLFRMLLVACLCGSSAQAREATSELRISIVCFKGTEADSERVDIYTAMPLQALMFVQTGSTYTAEYTVQCIVRAADGERVLGKRTRRRVTEARYDVSRGSTGKTDVLQTVCTLEPGEYTVDVIVTDDVAHRDFTISKRIRVPSFEANILSMSSVLFVSSLEQKGERYRITPHVSDNVGALDDGFFLFFETYNEEPLHDSVDVLCDIIGNGSRVGRLAKGTIDVRRLRAQQYLRVHVPADIASGSYVLRTVLVDPATYRDGDTTCFLARSERQIVIEQVTNGRVIDDIDKAARRLRYVATQTEIDSIRAASTAAERKRRFEVYWAGLDPTPGTLRNEAFEEYFERVDHVDRNFRSYNEGWLTDMGMIYIVLGPPSTVNRRVNTMDGTVVVEWTYVQANRRFLFIDYTTFGDFRLSTSTPFSPLEKYRYQRR
ncbi:MAG: GWxTD domain-containing protein [Candidatus Kapaibacterium sp.]